MAKKKKNTHFSEDEYGFKDVPYRTNERMMKDDGIYMISGRAKKERSVQSFIVKLFVVSVVLFITAALVSGIFSSYRMSNLKKEVEASSSPAFHSRYEGLGEEIIKAYFKGETPPVNLFKSANWPQLSQSSSSSGSSLLPASMEVTSLALVNGSQADAQLDGDKEELKTFSHPRSEVLVYTGVLEGKQYTFTVNLIIPDLDDARKIPYLVSPPSIMPTNDILSSDIDADRPVAGERFKEINPSETTIATVGSWAKAWAQGDGETLKRIAGDGNATHRYTGLDGFLISGSPSIEWAYEFENNKERSAVARVRFAIEKPVSDTDLSSPSTESSSKKDSAFRTEQVFDILLANYDEGSADIVAWDAGGRWKSLSKHMNATVVDPNSSVETTSTSPSSSSSGATSRTATNAPSLSSKTTESTSTKRTSSSPTSTSSRGE